MTSHEERRLLLNLSDLMASELEEQTDEDLAAGLREAERLQRLTVEWSQQIARVLKSRHSWSRMVELTGMPQTTLHQRVNPRPGAGRK